MKKLLGFVVMLGLLTITAYATDNNTLQTFSSGETISSSKVNQNFVFTSNYVVKSNGEIIGDFLSISGNEIYMITSKGYITKIDSTTGKISRGNAYSINNSCDGDAYGAVMETLSKLVANYKIDTLDLNDSTDFVGYIDSSTARINTTAYTKSAACYQQSTKELIQITQNNESITGVKNTYSLPISISK